MWVLVVLLVLTTLGSGNPLCTSSESGSHIAQLNANQTSFAMPLMAVLGCPFVLCGVVKPVNNVTWSVCSKSLGCSTFSSDSFTFAPQYVPKLLNDTVTTLENVTLSLNVGLKTNTTVSPVLYVRFATGIIDEEILEFCNVASVDSKNKVEKGKKTSKSRRSVKPIAPFASDNNNATLQTSFFEWEYVAGRPAGNNFSFSQYVTTFPLPRGSFLGICMIPLWSRDIIALSYLCITVDNNKTTCQPKPSGTYLSSSPNIWFWYPPPAVPTDAKLYSLSFNFFNATRVNPFDNRAVAGFAVVGPFKDMQQICEGDVHFLQRTKARIVQ